MLLLDIGNTRIKWATLGDRGLTPLQAAPYAAWTSTEITEHVLRPVGQQVRGQMRVIVANVGGARIAASLREAVVSTWGVEPEFMQSIARAGGVRNGYADPAQLGVDRWAALLGARHMSSRAACVVSVGTAMTVDGLDATGQHLGGLILPGPDLMMGSLLRNTSDLAERSRRGDAGAEMFADNTLGAIRQGACHALAALVERAVESMKSATGESPALLLTGGASAQVEPFIGREFQCVPDLVLRGLAILANPPAGMD